MMRGWCRRGRGAAKVMPGQTPHASFEPAAMLDLRKDVDVVLMRQDPPFHMGYITAAHLLELVQPDTLVVNDPAGVRSSPEKVLPLMFPELQPPTLVTRDVRLRARVPRAPWRHRAEAAARAWRGRAC